MEFDERGVDPLIERTCAECGLKLTDAEIQASLESGSPYLCTLHSLEQVPLAEEDAGPTDA